MPDNTIKKNKAHNPHNTENKTKHKKANRKKKLNSVIAWLLVVVVVGVLGLVISAGKFNKDRSNIDNATIIIAFNYDGISSYKMPNGDRFSIEYLTDSELLEKAIQQAGLEGKYSVSQVTKNLAIRGVYPEDLLDGIQDFDSIYGTQNTKVTNSADYITTKYSITLYNNFDNRMSEKELNSLVSEIANVGADYFMHRYVYSFDFSNAWDIIAYDSADYNQQLQFLETYVGMVRDYAADMDRRSSDFSYQGTRFADIITKCDDITNNKLSRISSFVTIKGFSKNPSRQNSFYNFRIKRLNNEVAYLTEEVADIDSLIEIYERDGTKYIGSGENVVVIDSNSTETYQLLVENRLQVMNQITENNKLITLYSAYIQDISTQMKESEIQSIKKEISDVKAIVDETVTQFSDILNSYVRTKFTTSAITSSTVKYSSTKLVSGAFIKTAIKVCAPMEMIVFFILFMHLWLQANRKYKDMNKDEVDVRVVDVK